MEFPKSVLDPKTLGVSRQSALELAKLLWPWNGCQAVTEAIEEGLNSKQVAHIAGEVKGLQSAITSLLQAVGGDSLLEEFLGLVSSGDSSQE